MKEKLKSDEGPNLLKSTWSVARCFDMTGQSKLYKCVKDKCLQARWCHPSQDADKCQTPI